MKWDWKSDLEVLKEVSGEDVLAPFIKEVRLDFLSNFYESPVMFMGIHCKTAEHAYQMMKTLDIQDRIWISNQPTARKAKQAGGLKGLNGRKITVRPDWEMVKVEIMEQIVRAKFFQNAGLARMLLNTGDSPMVELNWWGDDTWGWCVKTNGGANYLGFILEKIRNELRRLEHE